MSIFTFSKNSFKGQLPKEKTILLTRRHWFVLVGPFWTALLLILLPFVIYFFIKPLSWYGAISSLFWFLVAIYFLVLWNLIFYRIMIYALNTVAVTNKRIVESRQEGLFKHTVNELEINKVQDISIKIFGLAATILNFGDIEVQSAGAKGKFHFKKLPRPQKIKNTIMKKR